MVKSSFCVISLEDELGEGGGVDCSPVLQGMITRRIMITRSTYRSGFRVDLLQRPYVPAV